MTAARKSSKNAVSIIGAVHDVIRERHDQLGPAALDVRDQTRRQRLGVITGEPVDHA